MGERVVIVGAGPGGLASAVLLAHQGFEVTVLERRETVGGRTSRLEIDGFRWDLGPTFFLYPQVLEQILSAVGRSLKDEIPMRQLDPQYRISFGQGGSIDATPDVDRMEEAIAAVSPEDAAGLRPFLAENRRKLEAFMPVLQRPFLGLTDLLAPDLIKALPLLRPMRSLDQDLRRFFKDERIRLGFSFQSKYLGMSPMRCPSLFSILSFIEYEHGIFHPIGGCHAIMEALARIARDLGVDIRTDEGVEALKFEGRRVVGVETRRGVQAADAVVMNGDFARLMRRLVPDGLRRRWNDRKLDRSRFSCSTFMLYLGLEGEFPDLPHHNIHISSDYERNLREVETEHVLSEDPSFYVCNPGVSDSTMAPPGKSALYVLAPVTHAHPNVDWSVERDRYRDLVLDRLGAIGLEGIRERILVEKVITPEDWDRDLEIHLGATFNLTHDLGQMLHLRPRNRFEDLDGVYLVGGGTHPGSGLPVIFESARITAELVGEDLAAGRRRPGGRAVASAAEAAG